MIVDERSYTLHPGNMPAYLKIFEERGLPLQTKYLNRLLGYFISDAGTLNQVVALWAYDDYADRDRRRAALFADQAWLAYLQDALPLIAVQENRILIPSSFSPVK